MTRHRSATPARRHGEDADDHEVPPVAGQQRGFPASPGHRPPAGGRGRSSCCAAMTTVAPTGPVSVNWASTSAPCPGGSHRRARPEASSRLGASQRGGSGAHDGQGGPRCCRRRSYRPVAGRISANGAPRARCPGQEVDPRSPQRRIGPGGQLRPWPTWRSRRALARGGGRATAHGAPDDRRLRSRRRGQRAGEGETDGGCPLRPGLPERTGSVSHPAGRTRRHCGVRGHHGMGPQRRCRHLAGPRDLA